MQTNFDFLGYDGFPDTRPDGWFVYVLVLDKVDGFYVGRTNRLTRRLRRHILGTQSASIATRQHGVRGVLSLIPVTDQKESEQVEAHTLRELRSQGYMTFGS